MKKTVNILTTGGGFFVGVLLFCAVIVCYVFITHPSNDHPVAADEPLSLSSGYDVDNARTSSGKVSSETNEKMSVEDRLVQELTEFYGKTITEMSTQVLLLKIKNYLTRLYPDDGLDRFYSVLKRAFPKLADEIIKTLEIMELYLLWEKQRSHMLSRLNELEKEGLLWEKRKELFGDDAEEIWAEEVAIYEQRKTDVRDTISRLDGSYDTTIYEKLEEYQNSLSKAYKDTPEAYVLQNKDLLAKVFFGLNSVQKELKEMDPDQRKLEINSIRNEMGYTQAQIDKLEDFDEYRNRRWDNGLAYMEERDSIVLKLEGSELETALNELRTTYFKHEAKTIWLEEEEGFFRYTRKRVYGRN